MREDASAWQRALAEWGLPQADAQPVTIDGISMPLAWRSHLVAAGPSEAVVLVSDVAAAQGYTLVGLPDKPGPSAPPALLAALGIMP